jgi:hypothetical protein
MIGVFARAGNCHSALRAFDCGSIKSIWHILCYLCQPTTSNSGFCEIGMESSILGFIIWPGRSGQQYWYTVYPRHWRLGPGQPGNYIYAVESAPSKLLPLYIGQTSDLNRRLLEHDSSFNLFRATHLCAHFNYYDYGACGRLAEERDLIELWQPACNRSNQPSRAELLVRRPNRRLIASSSVMIPNDCSTSASVSF